MLPLHPYRPRREREEGGWMGWLLRGKIYSSVNEATEIHGGHGSKQGGLVLTLISITGRTEGKNFGPSLIGRMRGR